MSGRGDSRDREDRLARALRENLRRRKVQARGRGDAVPARPGLVYGGSGQDASGTGANDHDGVGPAGAGPADGERGGAAGKARPD